MVNRQIVDGNSPGGNTLPISELQCCQASVPQKSSTHRNPPLSRYARSCVASSLLSPMVPTSAAMMNGQLNNSLSVSSTTQWFGSLRPSVLTWAVVNSENRIIRLMPAYG